MNAIETRALTKIYGRKIGCKNITLSVQEGAIFGLLGPNGAGKSTFVKMMIGLIRPSSGSGALLGRPIGDVAVRRRIGFLPENFRYQDWLTGRELLAYHGALLRLDRRTVGERSNEVLQTVKLMAAADSKIRTYSKGMRQRVGIACALLGDPDLLFLDEPTSALDPVGRVEVREILLDLKKRGKTVFLNSHLLGEVERVCSEVAIMKAGSIVTTGTMETLLGGSIELSVRTSPLPESALRTLSNASLSLSADGSKMTVQVDNESSIAEIARIIIESGAELYELSPSHRSLEELFLEVVGEEQPC